MAAVVCATAEGDAAAAAPKACELLTNPELAAIFGQGVTQEPSTGSTATVSTCHWKTATAANGSIQVTAESSSTFAEYKKGSDAAVGPTEAVGGLGTGAYFGYQVAMGVIASAQLGVHDGKHIILVNLSDMSSKLSKADALARAKEAATKALARAK